MLLTTELAVTSMCKVNVQMYNHVVKDGQLQDHSLHVTAGLHCAGSG